MLVSSATRNFTSVSAYPSASTTAKPLTGITTRSEMSGNSQVDDARGYPTLLALTKSDINLIKNVTGVSIDYETGKTTPENFDASKVDFITAIADKRTFDYSFSTKAADDLSVDDLKDIFKKAAAQNHPLDSSLLDKALIDMFPSGRNEGDSSPGQRLDIYA